MGAALVGVGVVAALLSACSEPRTQPPTSSSTPSTSPETTAQTTATPSPAEPTPPAIPALAKEYSKEGAKAFVAWFIRSLNHAANSGDVSQLKRASDDCEGCNRYMDLYRKTYAQGASFTDPGWKPVSWFLRGSDGGYVVLTVVDAPAATYYPADGGKPREGTDDEFSLRFTVTRRAGQWVVTSLTGE